MPRRSLTPTERDSLKALHKFLDAYTDASDSDRPMVLVAMHGYLSVLEKELPPFALTPACMPFSPIVREVSGTASQDSIPLPGGH